MSAVFYRANEKTRSLNELFGFCSVEVKKKYIFYIYFRLQYTGSGYIILIPGRGMLN